jgi:tetratricopeptide (TPR) repeat protein
MKALEKDRGRRYETAAAFAADVLRYLNDEPVLACPPTPMYRFRKFARRNRPQLALAAGLGLVLAVGGGFAWHADRQAAALDRDERTRLARNAEAVAGLLDQCEADLRADRVNAASVSLGAAARRADDGGADDLAGRLSECRASLELVRELDLIAALSDTRTGGKLIEKRVVTDRFRAALAAYGMPPDEATAGDAARYVNRSPVRDRLLGALDWWLYYKPLPWFRAVLRDADPDPYRNAVRDALVAGNSQELAALAAQPDALAQPPCFAAVMGRNFAIPPSRRRAILASALQMRPGDRDVLFALGITYANSGPGLDGQIRWFQALVTAHPKFALAHIYLGNALMNKRDPDGAAVNFREAVLIDPTFGTHHSNLGRALWRIGDLPGAVASFREAVRLDPDHELARDLLAWLLATGPDGLRNGKEAVEHATRACEQVEWKSAGHLDTLAAANAEVGDFDRAVVLQKKAIGFPDVEKADREGRHERLGLYEQKKPYRDPELARELAPPPRVVKP